MEIDDGWALRRQLRNIIRRGEIVKFNEIRVYGKHKIEYEIVPIDLYKMMMENPLYDWGEPGCIFTERFRTIIQRNLLRARN